MRKNYKTSKHLNNTHTHTHTKKNMQKKINILKLSSNKKGYIFLLKVENPY